MMNEIFLNEFDEAEYLLNECQFNKTQSHTLLIIAKYYMTKGYDKNQTYQKLEEFLITCGEKPTNNEWVKKMRAAIKDAPKHDMLDINEIIITDNELKTITSSIKSVMTQRVAFTLLCLGKFAKLASKNEQSKIIFADRYIMKLANVNTSTLRQGSIYRELEDAQMVKFSNQVDGIAKTVMFESEGNPVMHITNMRNVGYQMMMHLGGDFFKCENCGTVVKRKSTDSKHHQKYCDDCAKKIKSQQSIASVKRCRAQA